MTDTAADPRRIGRYVLGEVLGRGAMGIVYKADDPLIARSVAVKLLHMTKALSVEQVATVRERFLREAQTAGNLDHPSIVRVLDAGWDDDSGELYLVMEYLPGASLESLVQEVGPLSRERICDLVRQIGSALDMAHARGVIHRDVKPANILFSEDGVAKIADFGIARITSSQLTQDMRDLGTPIYMSPEQVAGRPLDGRADLFSLGVMAYRLITGVTPFTGKNTVSVAYQIVHSAPPLPSSVAPDLPPALDRVMARILAKDPDDRYGSGREFYEDLARVLMGRAADMQTAKAPKPWRGTFDPRIVGVAALLLAGGGLIWYRGATRSALPTVTEADQAARASTREPRPGLPVEAPKTNAKASKNNAASQKGAGPSTAPATTARASGSPSPNAAKQATRAGSAERPNPNPVQQKAPNTHAPHAVAAATPPPVADAEPRDESQTGASVIAAETGSSNKAAVAGGGVVNLRLGHRIPRGTLAVWLDGQPILTETFSKKNKLVLYQTSSWLGIAVAAGRHEITAQVDEPDGTVRKSEAIIVDLEPDGTIDLRMVLKNDAVVWKRGG